MSDLTPLIKSHPSARLRALLASAELDVPPAGGKQRALAAMASVERREATTNFSGLSLGTTVHRLIGAVTLYESSSPLRLVLRSSLVGAAAGALALASIVVFRWTAAENTAAPLNTPASSLEQIGSMEARALRVAELEFETGHVQSALTRAREFLAANPSSTFRVRAASLEVKSLLRLGRIAEAESAAQPVLLAGPSAEATELQTALTAARQAAPATAPSR